MLNFQVRGKKILDIGCGNGDDLKKLSDQGASVYGVEPSGEFVNEANKKTGKDVVTLGVGENLPYSDAEFDVVISKYAIQTSSDAKSCMNESARVLVSGGILHVLIKHPIRQFLEKKKYSEKPVNYFKQEITKSVIYDGLIELAEPTHSMEDYLNADFFKNFELIDYRENFDFPASEQIDGDIYPTYFVLTARRK
ncbi:MAG: class I SAM-dependent methyltransferase [Minisyncoccia bacterium]